MSSLRLYKKEKYIPSSLQEKRVTIFRSRPNAVSLNEYLKVAKEILDLAQSMPGFLSFKSFTADDGEKISITEFSSAKEHQAWKEHLKHKEAQKLGYNKFYDEFKIQVCCVLKEYGHKKDTQSETT